MIFRKKKKRMIDVRELQRRGVVRIPKKDVTIPRDNEGFVELGKGEKKGSISSRSLTSSSAERFGFMDSGSNNSNLFSSSSEGYNKREVDAKITELDNKIYKLEQRLEVLERKAGVGPSSDSNLGVMGW